MVTHSTQAWSTMKNYLSLLLAQVFLLLLFASSPALAALPNGLQDVTPTTVPGSFISGFTLTKNTATATIFTDDPIGIYAYDAGATATPVTFTVSADGTTVGSFDLTGVAMPFYVGSGDTLTVQFTGNKLGGGTVTTTGTVDSTNA